MILKFWQKVNSIYTFRRSISSFNEFNDIVAFAFTISLTSFPHIYNSKFKWCILLSINNLGWLNHKKCTCFFFLQGYIHCRNIYTETKLLFSDRVRIFSLLKKICPVHDKISILFGDKTEKCINVNYNVDMFKESPKKLNLKT